MATKQCHTCKYNGKGNDACLTCKTNVAPSRRRSPIPPEQIPAPVADSQDEQEVLAFFREWIFLPPRLRDVFAALYKNRFVIAETARELKLGEHQVSYARDALLRHPYFAKFFPVTPSAAASQK